LKKIDLTGKLFFFSFEKKHNLGKKTEDLFIPKQLLQDRLSIKMYD